MSWLTERLRRRVDTSTGGPAADVAPGPAPADWDGAHRWPQDDQPTTRTADRDVPLMLNPNSPNIAPS